MVLQREVKYLPSAGFQAIYKRGVNDQQIPVGVKVSGVLQFRS
jgi:hypothetical protein